nr:MAG TPA: hypothetical protein [Caudoviricetes sp.]
MSLKGAYIYKPERRCSYDNRQRGCQLCVTLRKFYFFYYLAY